MIRSFCRQHSVCIMLLATAFKGKKSRLSGGPSRQSSRKGIVMSLFVKQRQKRGRLRIKKLVCNKQRVSQLNVYLIYTVFCVFTCMYRVCVLFHLRIFILICFVCTSVRTAGTEWQLNCTK